MPKFIIKPGYSFLDGDKLRGGGEQIEVADDIAAAHPDKLDPIPADAPAADAPALGRFSSEAAE